MGVIRVGLAETCFVRFQAAFWLVGLGLASSVCWRARFWLYSSARVQRAAALNALASGLQT